MNTEIITYSEAWRLLTFVCFLIGVLTPLEGVGIIIWLIGTLVIWQAWEFDGLFDNKDTK